MPKYIFTIRAGHEGNRAEQAAVLNDDAAALTYASELARELVQSDERPDTSWLVKVSDEARSISIRDTVFSSLRLKARRHQSLCPSKLKSALPGRLRRS